MQVWQMTRRGDRCGRVYENAKGQQAVVVSRDVLGKKYRVKFLQGDYEAMYTFAEFKEKWSRTDIQCEIDPPHRIKV